MYQNNNHDIHIDHTQHRFNNVVKYSSVCRKHFPVLSSLMTYHRVCTRLTRRVPIVEQELLSLPEHLNSPPVFRGVCVTRSLVLCVCFVDRFLSFVLFRLAIVLSVLLRFTDSDYPFGIFKLF